MSFSDITNIRLEEFRLPNSLCLFAHPDRVNPLICLQLYIKTGSAQESQKHYGYAHFLEHLVFKSTKKYPDNQISTVSSAMGMVLNAYTDFDATCYYLMLPKERLTEAMDILAQMAFNANFSEADVKTEKDIIIEEIHQYESDPEMSFIEHIQSLYFKKSPLSHPVLGTEANLSATTRHCLRAFYRKHYRPSNAFLVATGDFDLQHLQAVFSQAFSAWDDNSVKPRAQAISYHGNFRFISRKRHGPELLALVLPELNEQHPDSEALHIAIRYLAIGKSSMLHKELVEERKLCSFVKVSSVSGLIPGISVILMAPTHARHKNAILKSFEGHWSAILCEGVPQEAMKLVKKDIIHSWLYSFDGVEHKANLIAAEMFNQNLERIRNYGNLVESMDNTHIIQAVNEFWAVSRLAIYYQGHSEFQFKTLKQTTAKQAMKPQAQIEAVKPYRPKDISLGTSFKTDYFFYTLPGGMKCVYNYVPKRPICGFALSTPLCQLNDNKAGQNFFTSAMMLYGTRKHSHVELMKISREKGFNIRAQSHLDSTLFRGKCHFQDLPEVLGLLQEIILMPAFEERFFMMLKSAALDSIRRELDYPASYAYTRWFNQVFGKGNNLLRATGEPPEIKAVTLKDCIQWHNSWHLGRDFSLCIVGSLEPALIQELIGKLFACSPVEDHTAPHAPLFFRSPATLQRQYKHKEQSIIHIGGYACPASRRIDNSAFHVLAQALGGDLASRMFIILREKYGFAYQTGFDFSSIEDLGFWYAYAFCDPEDHLDCLHVTQEILNDVAKSGITADELKAAQNYLISLNRFDTESVAFRAATIANLISLGYTLDYHLQREQRIASTTLEQTKSLAAEWLAPDNHYIHVMV